MATEHLQGYKSENQKSFHLALIIKPLPKPYIFFFPFLSFFPPPLFLEFGSCGSETLQV